ncbi:hypothetical protein OOU_Y34scaffold01073g11 [Pyricularia oryzae Y34]|uniref:Uncharacterized protein n=2 Tax=Pyricularia oryzae TaxID=318829 RepID=A0AA97PFJ7_PYRO3|nr:hypothetical protein OOU_Y34scaffold01073g11 [Pyricularia oryzae Y34]
MAVAQRPIATPDRSLGISRGNW